MPVAVAKYAQVEAESFNEAWEFEYRGLKIPVEAGQTVVMHPGGVTVLDTEDFVALFAERTAPVAKAYLT